MDRSDQEILSITAESLAMCLDPTKETSGNSTQIRVEQVESNRDAKPLKEKEEMVETPIRKTASKKMDIENSSYK